MLPLGHLRFLPFSNQEYFLHPRNSWQNSSTLYKTLHSPEFTNQPKVLGIKRLFSSWLDLVSDILHLYKPFSTIRLASKVFLLAAFVAARSPPPTPNMCNFTKNYYIYSACSDPGAHFCKTSTDGSREQSCPAGPHERFIVIPESCPLCYR